ncbi:predicted protein [Histoplasma capsulatum G186AR]|uniref:Uncharacterized protein n=1 Tax=Ajellomyces capsulatus (strain G186AR / H82 / ATCC MYA-2454 / RMSCC 2432) TaxID=447093 RepID=C0NYT9_AJECG|nr:uncharacterized protein HCBG_08319 [Histoplasma capsulatum G186AR]EEH03379.1 predicted protein [Histoplasma capsulatum G186AR]
MNPLDETTLQPPRTTSAILLLFARWLASRVTKKILLKSWTREGVIFTATQWSSVSFEIVTLWTTSGTTRRGCPVVILETCSRLQKIIARVSRIDGDQPRPPGRRYSRFLQPHHSASLFGFSKATYDVTNFGHTRGGQVAGLLGVFSGSGVLR